MNKWKRTLLPLDSTIQEAILNLNDSALQIVMVISKEGKFIGTITDGDIRRGLMRGLEVSSFIDSIVNRNAFVVPPQIDKEFVLNIFKVNKINRIPIVDGDRNILGLHLADNLSMSIERDNWMIVMAGGLGTRLRPETEKCPKPLLPVRGKPILEHIISRAKTDGFRYFHFAIHYLGHMIEDYFGKGDLWEVDIKYLKEKEPLGTAGALGLITPKPEQPFLVTNGDILTDIRYSELLDYHKYHDAVATMAVRMYEWRHPFGVVETEGIQINGFKEKPITKTYVNAGIYILNPNVLNLLPPNKHCDMPQLFERLKLKGLKTIVYPIHEPWLDVGEHKSLSLANSDYKIK